MAWGEPPNQRLSWFGLTDGWYQINLGNQPLYHPRIERIKKYKPDFEVNQIDSEFDLSVDYQVVRLYEDLLDILPNVMQDLPSEIYRLIRTFDMHAHLQSIYYRGGPDDPNDEWLDVHEMATSWYSSRFLTSMHLMQGPVAVFTRYGDEITIRWDNRIEGEVSELIWAPSFGEFKVSFEQFIREVEDFHSDLMNAMETRIQMIQNENPIPHIEIDLKALITEHADRKHSLANALARKPRVDDWDKVIASNHSLYPLLFKS